MSDCDLVKRLRDLAASKHDDLSIGDEAAARIEALAARMAKLEEALRPFAAEAERFKDSAGEIYRYRPDKYSKINNEHFRAAIAALGEAE